MVKKTGNNRIGAGAPGPGRPKGAVNKTTATLKEAILRAAERAGDGDMTAYLEKQARENPNAFLSILGKVLPLTLSGDAENPVSVAHRVEHVIVDPQGSGSA